MFLETPPPAWGRLAKKPDLKVLHGNTPTCVGKTELGMRPADAHQKHPHLRGEDHIDTSRQDRAMETPPPAWGRPGLHVPGVCVLGNTPTCVGKTRRGKNLPNSSEKHPHLRGEDKRATRHQLVTVETPPPAWGRLIEASQAVPLSRNTPTCVGKTIAGNGLRQILKKHPHLRGEDAS